MEYEYEHEEIIAQQISEILKAMIELLKVFEEQMKKDMIAEVQKHQN